MALNQTVLQYIIKNPSRVFIRMEKFIEFYLPQYEISQLSLWYYVCLGERGGLASTSSAKAETAKQKIIATNDQRWKMSQIPGKLLIISTGRLTLSNSTFSSIMMDASKER